MAQLLFGVVEVWQANYPERDSLLWQQLCVRAVGAALRAQLLKAGADWLRHNRDHLRAEIKALLDKELSEVQVVLETGVGSLADAERVLAGTTELVREVVPEIVWEKTEPVIAAEVARLRAQSLKV
jgi:hypothetical protein